MTSLKCLILALLVLCTLNSFLAASSSETEIETNHISSSSSSCISFPVLASVPVEEVETQKFCEICYVEVDLVDCLQCCTNNHHLHSSCFQTILSQPARYQYKCPLCREKLIFGTDELFNLVYSTDPSQTQKCILIKNHLKLYKSLRPQEFETIDWKYLLEFYITAINPEHLRFFLQLELVDINSTFSDGSCAISLLIDTFGRSFHEHCNDHLIQKFQILLSHRNLILNRQVSKSNLHLIYHAIDANHFEIFLQILDASPQLNILKVFSYASAISDRLPFTKFLLDNRSSDIELSQF